MNKAGHSRRYFIMASGLGLVVVLVMIIWVNLQGIAGFLIVPETVIKADLAIVLSGGSIPRVLTARDLYKKGSVEKILLIPEPNGSNAADKELHRLGINLVKSNELTSRILKASHVPLSDVLTLPQAINGTINEAKAVKEYLGNTQKFKRVVIVTSGLSSQRQCYIFRQVLVGVEVLCSASAYTRFEVDNWWKHPRRALGVLIEYLKFTANFLTLLV